MVFKTGASTIQINTGTKSTGDYGAPRAIDRWIIGAGAAGTFGWAAISVKEIIARGIEDSDPDQTTIYNYLSSKYGI
jgi:hypothetical protein